MQYILDDILWRNFLWCIIFKPRLFYKLKYTFYVFSEDQVERRKEEYFKWHLTIGEQHRRQQLVPIARERLTNFLEHRLQRPVESLQTSVGLRMVGRSLELRNITLQ